MRQYAIFGGKCFYARGGFHDLIGTEATIRLAVMRAESLANQYDGLNGVEWWQVVDLHSGTIITQSESVALGAEPHNAEPYHLRVENGFLVPTRTKDRTTHD
jgi:hypothetical protein